MAGERKCIANLARLGALMDEAGLDGLVLRSGQNFTYLAGFAWGTGGLLGSLLGHATGLSPLAVAAYRLGLGGLLVLLAVGVAQRNLRNINRR